MKQYFSVTSCLRHSSSFTLADVGTWQAAMELVALQAKDAREPLSAKGQRSECRM